MHFLFHIFPTMERDPPSCPLSSSDDTAAMDKNHQFVWVGKGIMTHEDEGKWLFGFEVILQGRQAGINKVTMACERGPAFQHLQKASNVMLGEMKLSFFSFFFLFKNVNAW